uniref:Putative secreted protein n=1 Tax=Rhipicephalus microplus TaxID=6941 RepID=A0A6M2DDG5_RHIMP
MRLLHRSILWHRSCILLSLFDHNLSGLKIANEYIVRGFNEEAPYRLSSGQALSEQSHRKEYKQCRRSLQLVLDSSEYTIR